MTMTAEEAPETDHTPSVTAIAADCDANRISIDAQSRHIDALRARMDARFAHVDDRFDRVDKRFEQVDARFAEVDARFDGIDGRLNKLEAGQIEMRDILADIRAWVEEQPKAPKKKSAKK